MNAAPPTKERMNPAFETIGLEVSNEKAFNYLAERAGDQGEPTRLSRRGAVLETRRRSGGVDRSL
jgi:hypothetical protein